MNSNLPFAMIALQRAFETEMHSARPHAPVVPDKTRAKRAPRTYRTRAAVATRLDRVAEAVAPAGWAHAQQAATTR